MIGKLKVSLVGLFKRQLRYKTESRTPKERMCVIILMLVSAVLNP